MGLCHLWFLSIWCHPLIPGSMPWLLGLCHVNFRAYDSAPPFFGGVYHVNLDIWAYVPWYLSVMSTLILVSPLLHVGGSPLLLVSRSPLRVTFATCISRVTLATCQWVTFAVSVGHPCYLSVGHPCCVNEITVKHGVTTIHEDSAACWSQPPACQWRWKQSLMSYAGLPPEVTDHMSSSSQIQWVCYKKWKVEWEAQTVMCEWSTSIFENSCWCTALDMLVWMEITEQKDWQVKQSSQVACFSEDLKCWGALRHYLQAQSQGHYTIWSPGGERRGKRKR